MGGSGLWPFYLPSPGSVYPPSLGITKSPGLVFHCILKFLIHKNIPHNFCHAYLWLESRGLHNTLWQREVCCNKWATRKWLSCFWCYILSAEKDVVRESVFVCILWKKAEWNSQGNTLKYMILLNIILNIIYNAVLFQMWCLGKMMY